MSRIVSIEHDLCNFFLDVSAFSLSCIVGTQAVESQYFNCYLANPSTLHVLSCRLTHLAIGLLVVKLVDYCFIDYSGSFCHVMWVCKQEAAAEWQEFATPTAALSQVKAKGALNCATSAD